MTNREVRATGIERQRSCRTGLAASLLFPGLPSPALALPGQWLVAAHVLLVRPGATTAVAILLVGPLLFVFVLNPHPVAVLVPVFRVDGEDVAAEAAAAAA